MRADCACTYVCVSEWVSDGMFIITNSDVKLNWAHIHQNRAHSDLFSLSWVKVLRLFYVDRLRYANENACKWCESGEKLQFDIKTYPYIHYFKPTLNQPSMLKSNCARFIHFVFLPFSFIFIEFFFRQLTMHDDILQTEHKEKKLVFYYAFGSRFSRERNWMAELNFYARNLWSNITNIIFAIEIVTSYCIATMNKSDDVLTMGEILFSFVTNFFFRKKKHFFANGITEILCHKQIWNVNLIQLLSSVLSVVWLQSTNKKMTGLR